MMEIYRNEMSRKKITNHTTEKKNLLKNISVLQNPHFKAEQFRTIGRLSLASY